jgi:hypothetical protein
MKRNQNSPEKIQDLKLLQCQNTVKSCQVISHVSMEYAYTADCLRLLHWT